MPRKYPNCAWCGEHLKKHDGSIRIDLLDLNARVGWGSNCYRDDPLYVHVHYRGAEVRPLLDEIRARGLHRVIPVPKEDR